MRLAAASVMCDVRPFLGPGRQWRVSTEAGRLPLWSPTAHQLLFVMNSQNKVMFAPYDVVGDSFRAEKPQLWSPTSMSGSYDLNPDGKPIAAARPGTRAAPPRIESSSSSTSPTT